MCKDYADEVKIFKLTPADRCMLSDGFRAFFHFTYLNES